jgi:hypothetical protein
MNITEGICPALRAALLVILALFNVQAQTETPCSGLRSISRWHGQLSASITGTLQDRGHTEKDNQSGTFQLDLPTRQSDIDPNGSDYTFFGTAIGNANIDDSNVYVDPITHDTSTATTKFFGGVLYPNDVEAGPTLSFTTATNGACAYIFQYPFTIPGVTFTSDDSKTGEHTQFISYWDWIPIWVTPTPDGKIDPDTAFLPPLIVGIISIASDGTVQPITQHANFSRVFSGILWTADVQWSILPGPPEDLDTSPIKTTLTTKPPDADARTFVTSSGSLPNSKCLFRSEGPIRFNIEVKRSLGELTSEGTLKYADELIAQGMLSPTAKLVMPAYDVDSAAPPKSTRNPERDRVLFNGEEIGYLKGSNDSWDLNTFEVDIRKVHFAQRAAVGSEPDPAINEITIEVDTANPNTVHENWCTAIGWSALSIKAMSPVILIHGNGAEKRGYGEYFRQKGLTDAFDQAHLPYDLSVKLQSGPIQVNGASLTSQIPNIIKSFGADSAHLVTHSKGGLDSRDYLQIYREDKPKTVSLITIATPHLGTIGAEAVTLAKDGIPTLFSGPYSSIQTLGAFFVAHIKGYNDGLPFVTPPAVADFNQTNLPSLPDDISYFTVVDDADQNNSGTIDIPSEWTALQPDVPFQWLADAAYQLLRNNTSIVFLPNLLTGGLVGVAIPSTGPIGNDTAVQLPSQRGDDGFSQRVSTSLAFEGANGRNHASVLDAGVGQAIIPLLVRAEQAHGDLK